MYSIARLKAEDRKALFNAYSFQYRESPEIVEKDLRKDFESMKAIINDDEIKSFDELIENLKNLEEELNK